MCADGFGHRCLVACVFCFVLFVGTRLTIHSVWVFLRIVVLLVPLPSLSLSLETSSTGQDETLAIALPQRSLPRLSHTTRHKYKRKSNLEKTNRFMRESRILLNNAAVVESIFRELGPGFTTCFRYEDMADPAQAARVSKFLAPTDYVAERLEEKMLDNVRPRSAAEYEDRKKVRMCCRPACCRPVFACNLCAFFFCVPCVQSMYW